MREPTDQEEEEEAVTPIRSDPSIGSAAEGGAPSPPASNISGFGFETEATDPDDETRPVTKQEFTRFRHRVEKTFQRMYADVIGLIRHEVKDQDRQREALKEMMVGRLEALVPMGVEPEATTLLEEKLETKLGGLRDNMVVVTDTLADKLQTLEDMVLAVSTMAEEAVAKLAKDVEDQRSDMWSDWDILDDQGFQMLQSRVAELEANPAVSAAEVQELWEGVREIGADSSIGSVLELQTQLQKQMKEVLERVADLEGEGPNGYTGGVPRQTKVDQGRWGTSVMDSKVVMSLGQLTDDKSAFRQWDLKLINALNYLRPGYGKALDRLKECIDRGTGPEDVRPGASSDWCDAHFGPLLVESLRGAGGKVRSSRGQAAGRGPGVYPYRQGQAQV